MSVKNLISFHMIVTQGPCEGDEQGVTVLTDGDNLYLSTWNEAREERGGSKKVLEAELRMARVHQRDGIGIRNNQRLAFRNAARAFAQENPDWWTLLPHGTETRYDGEGAELVESL